MPADTMGVSGTIFDILSTMSIVLQYGSYVAINNEDEDDGNKFGGTIGVSTFEEMLDDRWNRDKLYREESIIYIYTHVCIHTD